MKEGGAIARLSEELAAFFPVVSVTRSPAYFFPLAFPNPIFFSFPGEYSLFLFTALSRLLVG